MRSGVPAAYRMLRRTPEEALMMTTAELDAIRDRHAAATGGPWGVEEVGRQLTVLYRGTGEPVALCGDPDAPGSEENAEFVAASWEDVRDLLAEVHRLRGDHARVVEDLANQDRKLRDKWLAAKYEADRNAERAVSLATQRDRARAELERIRAAEEP